MANNHIWDFGENGFKRTVDELKGCVLIGAGKNIEDSYKEVIFSKNMTKIGFLAAAEWGFGASENSGGFAWLNHDQFEVKIKNIRKMVDILIVQLHAGLELVDIPLPEWRQKYKHFIDLGVDLIIGHHPHIVQPWEKYRGKYIFYSLGNFYFGKNDKSIAVSVSIKNRSIVLNKIISIEAEKNSIIISKNKVVNNNKLTEPKYIKSVTKEINKVWKERYQKYYEGMVTQSIFRNKKINENMLRHNLRIETHLFSTFRYLAQKTNEK